MTRGSILSRLAGVSTTIVLTLALATGCGERAVTPTAPALSYRPSFGVVPGAPVAPTLVRGLARTKPVASAQVRLFVSALTGGSVVLPGSGMRLIVPAHAVARDMTITVTAIPGDLVAYDFQPHGLVFSAPVVLEQSFEGTDAANNSSLHGQLVGGYFPDASMLASTAAGLSTVVEFEPTDVDPTSGTVRITLSHFSGYIVALGTTPPPPPPDEPPAS
ncbi:MAG: hypothetical protein NVS1B4_26540 [Gemmatimonadaceae bacterium]